MKNILNYIFSNCTRAIATKSFLMLLLLIAPVLTIIGQNIPAYVPKTGLIAWWPFTGNAIDSSGNSHDGTVYGAVLTNDRFGNINSSYSFNGLNDYLQLGSSNFSEIDKLDSGNISISFWMNPTSSAGYAIMNFGWGFRIGLSGDYPFIPDFEHVGDDAGNNKWYVGYGSDSLKLGKWYHIIGVKDSQSLKLYVNGILVTNYKSNPIKLGNQIYIGGNPIDNRAWLKGKLDDIAIWSRALNQVEITSLYQSKIPSNSAFFAESENIDIHPNPVISELIIDQNQLIGNNKYEILNSVGCCMKSGIVNSVQERINVAELPSGLYFIRISGLSSYKFYKL